MNDNKELLQRIEKLERELAVYKRAFQITPTKIIINQSLLINGLLNANRVYTKRSGNHVELTT